MRQETVVFDLETGGIEPRPSIMSRPQYEALEKYDRGPKPMFPVNLNCELEMFKKGDWAYCPGNPVIQVAAIACEADTWEPLETFEVKLGFRRELATGEALEINSFDHDLWIEESVRCFDGLEMFRAFLDRHKTVELISKKGNPYNVAQLCGHNAASFDLDFILRSFQDPEWQKYALPGDAPRKEPVKGIFFPGSFQVIDTLHLARWVLAGQVEDFKLGTLAEHFKIPTPTHDALADVRVTVEVARMLQRMIK